MSAIRVALTGDQAMKEKFRNAARNFPKEIRKACRNWAGPKLDEVRARTPVKTGNLRDTEKIRVSIRKSAGRENVSVSIVAGGPEALYARRVHETHETMSNFLGGVITESAGTAGVEIAADLDLRTAVQ